MTAFFLDLVIDRGLNPKMPGCNIDQILLFCSVVAKGRPRIDSRDVCDELMADNFASGNLRLHASLSLASRHISGARLHHVIGEVWLIYHAGKTGWA